MRLTKSLALPLALSLALGCGSGGKKDKPGETPVEKPGETPAEKPAEKPDAAKAAAALVEEGKQAEAKGDYAAARDKYLAAEQADPGNADAARRREGLDELIEAQKQLEANASSPNDRKAELEVRLADSFRKRGDAEKASAHYRTAMELKPDATAAHLGQGAVSVEQGSFKDALTSYSKAIEADPQCAQAHYELAFLNRTAQVEGATPAKALEHARKAAELAPTNPAMLELLAECYKDAGDLEKGIQALEEAVRASGGKQRLQDKLAKWKGASK